MPEMSFVDMQMTCEFIYKTNFSNKKVNTEILVRVDSDEKAFCFV